MPLTDDRDLIRGLGYVALYAAYLEKAIEDVFVAVVAEVGMAEQYNAISQYAITGRTLDDSASAQRTPVFSP